MAFRTLGLSLLLVCGCASERAEPAATPIHPASTPLPATSEAAPGRIAPEPMAPGTLWAPNEPSAAAGELAWAQVELQSACATDARTGQLTILSNAQQFEAAVCRRARLDWSRFRLALVHVASHALDVTITPEATRLNVVIQSRSDCDAAWGETLALLIPADSKSVNVIERPLPGLPCPEGHAY